MDDPQQVSQETRKQDERRLFIFLIVFLFPMLAVAIVGGYGFAVWMLQSFVSGAPAPPGQ
ncbi:periplasmic nitrate reductase, NapE protein [Marinobacter sp.]|uniref:periplasmic nitrate reductase, NapE protein n=1 Tax=Marinobacter sp. TaxID=50741 RepID=UPI00384A95CF